MKKKRGAFCHRRKPTIFHKEENTKVQRSLASMQTYLIHRQMSRAQWFTPTKSSYSAKQRNHHWPINSPPVSLSRSKSRVWTMDSSRYNHWKRAPFLHLLRNQTKKLALWNQLLAAAAERRINSNKDNSSCKDSLRRHHRQNYTTVLPSLSPTILLLSWNKQWISPLKA